MSGFRSSLIIVALLLAPALASAQESAGAFDLTVANIMRGPELVGTSPMAVRWTDDSRWVYFRWKPGGLAWHEETSLYRVPAVGGAPEKLPEAAADSLAPLLAEGDTSPDGRFRAVAARGDLYLIERANTSIRRLTDTQANESDPTWARASDTLYFLRDNNLFSLELSTGAMRQLTNIRTGPKPKEDKEAEGQRAILEQQQLELFEAIRIRAARDSIAEARREAREAAAPEPFYLEQGERLAGLIVDPAARYAIIEVGKTARDERRTMVPDYVTLSGYTEPLEVRTNVGDAQSESRTGLITLPAGTVSWLKLVPAELDSAAKKAGHAALADASFVGWDPTGSTGLIVATGYDFKNRWFYALDAASGTLTLLAHDQDEAWLQGPCDNWSDDGGCAGWMPDGRTVYFVSERDGYSHLYTVGADGKNLRQLTRGPWEVHDARISHARDAFYLTTSEGSPYEQHFYRMALDGGERVRITAPPGFHNATVSPDGRRLAIVHSSSARPPELFLADNQPGAALQQVTQSPTDEWQRGPWITPPIVEFTARDGVKVPARIYRPADFGAASNGAGVVFVHGAGYLQNVHRGWSGYYREYMFHHLLASRGYTVIDVDYRGSAGYGRDWRTAVYRYMGGKDLDDIVDAARYLAASEQVDPARIGLYGGSYGGFITLMALFTEADEFAAGAALRSVTDWAHYNHWYTSRILNLPQTDTTAYRRSSPIFFAEGLEDPLLIAHGMVDTNVHFQDVVRLAQRLIELGKTDWEMAVYPVENHGFIAPSSWADEYRRILELFDRHLAGSAAQRPR